MARYVITGSDTVIGGKQNDVYVIDPNNLGHVQITDKGGDGDMLTVYDRQGRTAGEFVVDGGALIWRNPQGDEVRITLNADDSSPIEFFRWIRLAEDGGPQSQILTVVLPGTAITGPNVAAAGTVGGDRLEAPNFASFQDGWSDIYGNLGNDTLIGSNNHACYLYGGRGNDLLQGKGAFDDWFFGDAGNDVIKGGAGDDNLYGDLGRDTLTGGVGNDVLSGGSGADAFTFNPREIGSDTITDYGTGDRLVFDGIARSKVHAMQDGADVVVSIGTWGQVLVEHTLVADLMLTFT